MSPGPFGSGAFGTGVFSSSPLYSTKDLIDAILRHTGHSNPDTETNKRAAVLGFLNNRYATVTTKRQWDWLYQSVDINFKAPYETGTLSLTQNSESVTGVGTVWSSNVVPNNYLVPTGRNERYLIETVDSQTTLTLQGQYAGDTATDVAYKIVKPVVELPSDCEHVQGIVLGESLGKLVPLGLQEMRRKQAHDLSRVGVPVYFTEVGRRAEDGVRHIEIWPAPDKDYVAQLNYGVNIMALEDSASNYPLIPDRHRVVLYYGGLADMYMFLRDPTNFQLAQANHLAALQNMFNDTQITDSRLILQPARNYRNGRRRSRRLKTFMDRADFSREE